MIGQIKHVDLSKKVYEILKEMIFKRQFVGGQKLDLNSLSEKMNISRTPLKDAINRLDSEGLVEVIPRKGTYVKKLETKDIVNMMEMRLMMEKWALTHFDKDKFQSVAEDLEKILIKSKDIVKTEPFDYLSFLDLDSEFHKLIIMSHGNDRMTAAYTSMNIPFQITRVFYFKNHDRSINTQEEHEKIVNALKSSDLNRAIELLTIHLEVSRDNMVSILEKNGGYI